MSSNGAGGSQSGSNVGKDHTKTQQEKLSCYKNTIRVLCTLELQFLQEGRDLKVYLHQRHQRGEFLLRSDQKGKERWNSPFQLRWEPKPKAELILVRMPEGNR